MDTLNVEWKVDVIHWLSPYHIWVEVYRDGTDIYNTFEQIGLYGVVPKKFQKNNVDVGAYDWSAATLDVMNVVLNGAKSVTFIGCKEVDQRTLLRNKTQKFGTITMEIDGEYVDLAEYLCSKVRGCVIDIPSFEKKLNSHNIRTYVTKDKQDMVYREMETRYLMLKGLTPLPKIEEMTEENLLKHNYAAFKRDRAMMEEREMRLIGKKASSVHNAYEYFMQAKNKMLAAARTRKKDMEEAGPSCEGEREAMKAKSLNTKPTIPPLQQQKLIAFGPPDVNKSKLKIKSVPADSPAGMSQIHHYNDSEKATTSEGKSLGEKSSDGKSSDGKTSVVKTCEDKSRKFYQGVMKVLEINKLKRTESVKEDNHKAPEKKEKLLQRNLKFFKALKRYNSSNSSSSNEPASLTDDTTDGTSIQARKLTCEVINQIDDDAASDVTTMSELVKRMNIRTEEPKAQPKDLQKAITIKTHVNPFRNVDPSISKFVDGLTCPILMVHSKLQHKIHPTQYLRDVPFTSQTHMVLKNMGVKDPMTLQTVSWTTILRGYSLTMISPPNSGKTLGYVPAVCRIVNDYDQSDMDSNGPICVILCATAKSVNTVENLCKKLCKKTVFACYDLSLTDIYYSTITRLLNGCELLITTPCDFSLLASGSSPTNRVDLRRLNTFVMDDFERLDQLYLDHVKFAMMKIKEMLKNRLGKQMQVQYVIASRQWCDSLNYIVKKVPNSVVSVGAFQECVLYSQTNMTIQFVNNLNKINALLTSLRGIDRTKATVIVCRNDDEVELIGKELRTSEFRNSCITVLDSYEVTTLREVGQQCMNYSDVDAFILVCCDAGLFHLNITNAVNLYHFSLPTKYSLFTKRFSALVDNYPSVFEEGENKCSVKIFLDDTNTEQLPKIMHFLKRCTDNIPDVLDEVCADVVKMRDMAKADNMVPICDRMLTLGECPDIWNCTERHTVTEEHDTPPKWLPQSGIISFKPLHYLDATLYSGRLLKCEVSGQEFKYPQNYGNLSLQMGYFYSNEANKVLHGIPKVGDVCATALRENFFVRCKVIKILTRYENNGNPDCVLVKLIDEEKYERTRDIYLFHLPDKLRNTETYVMQIRLANLQPKGSDCTFSEIARRHIESLTDNNDDLFLRGEVKYAIGNTVFVDSLYVCTYLSTSKVTAVRYNIVDELMDTYADPNPDLLNKIKEMCPTLNRHGQLPMSEQSVSSAEPEEKEPPLEITKIEEPHSPKEKQMKPKQLIFEELHGDWEPVAQVLSFESVDSFCVSLADVTVVLQTIDDQIKKYMAENSQPDFDVKKGMNVLAINPEFCSYKRAVIRKVCRHVTECYFVDTGEVRAATTSDIWPMPDELYEIPCQAIECSLIGVKPSGSEWCQFSNNWLHDQLVYAEKTKSLYVQRFTTERSKNTVTKYVVGVVDAAKDKNVILNQLMIELNLAKEVPEEAVYLEVIEKELKSLKQQYFKKHLIDEMEKTESELQFLKQTKLFDFFREEMKEKERELNILKEQHRIFCRALQKEAKEREYQYEKEQNKKYYIKLQEDLKERELQYLKEQNEKYDFEEEEEERVIEQNEKYDIKEVEEEKESELKSLNEQDNKDSPIKSEKQEVDDNAGVWSFSDDDSANEWDIEFDQDELRSIFKVEGAAVPLAEALTNKENLKADDMKPTADSVSAPNSSDSDIGDFEVVSSKNTTLDSDDLSSPDLVEPLPEVKPSPRKPKVYWRQDKRTVTLRIMLSGILKYDMEIEERRLKFNTTVDDTEYGFDLELYGVVEPSKSVHRTCGLYAMVRLTKVLSRTWLTLPKEGGIKKWIVVDPDSIDTSSDEDDDMVKVEAEFKKGIYKAHYDDSDDDDDDENMTDDVTFRHKYLDE